VLTTFDEDDEEGAKNAIGPKTSTELKRMVLEFFALNITCESNNILPSLGVNLLVQRFGIFDFAGFIKAPNRSYDTCIAEVKEGVFHSELPPCNGACNPSFDTWCILTLKMFSIGFVIQAIIVLYNLKMLIIK